MKNAGSENKNGFGVREFFSLFFRLFVGGIFVYAAYEKIINPYSFYRSINEYEILPLVVVPFFAIAIPWLEMVAGVLLVLGAFYRASGLVILALMVVFEIAIIVNLIRGVDMDCGCGLPLDFIGISEKLTWLTVLRDMIFVFMAVEIAFFSRPRLALDLICKKHRSSEPKPE